MSTKTKHVCDGSAGRQGRCRLNRHTKPSGSASPGNTSTNCQQPLGLASYGQQSLAGLLTRKEVADALKVCVHSIARYTKSGMLPCVRFNQRTIRYDPQTVQAFIQAGAAK